MSDFSGMEQSFALPGISPVPAVDAYLHSGQPASTELQPHEVGFRRLRGPREISRVMHLRRAIALPASALEDPQFQSREKKETKSVS
jgi:hypothetical protein